MGKRTIYECDLCGKTSENELGLKLTKVILTFVSNVNETNGAHNTECELCKKCISEVSSKSLIEILRRGGY